MKKILVTGSSGYIGQHLVKLLKKEGYEVFGIDKEKRINDYLLPKQFELHDINNDWPRWYNTLTDWPEKFDTVVHLAAKVRVNESMEFPYEYYTTNFNGTLNVLDAFQYDNFIFASTGAAETPISPYALSKRCAEDVVREYCTRSKLNYTMFRFYNVIGSDGVPPTNPDGLMYNLIKAKDTGEINIFGNDYNTIDGTPVRDYVHVMDICRAIQRAIKTPANSLENLGTGTGYTVKEIARAFFKVNGINCNVEYLPRRNGDAERTVLDEPSTYMINSYTLDELVKV
jgi:UDP-glucose 4-epimerase